MSGRLVSHETFEAICDYAQREYVKGGATTMQMIALDLRKVAAELAITQAALSEAREECDHLSDEVHDLRQAPWPEWAEKCLKIIRDCSGSAEEESDLPEELEELLSEWERSDEQRARADALAVQLAKAEARCGELVKALEPFAEAARRLDQRTDEQIGGTYYIHDSIDVDPDFFGEALTICSVGDLRRAVKALAPAPNGDNGA